ncbi:MAG: pirin family protein [Lentisphaeria bacterium]|nr:pirin family protein [Lentisphaeria bacterium]
MIDFLSSKDRGVIDRGWLKSYPSFSFSSYHNPERMGFGSLVVMNEDFIAARSGFGMHGHEDMEIITYVLKGIISHEDSLGSKGEISSGMLQKMSAGTGIRHSEYNHTDEEVHLYQIWIEPDRKGLTPDYHEVDLKEMIAKPGLHELAGRDVSLPIQISQDVKLSLLKLEAQGRYDFTNVDKAWFQVLIGKGTLNEHTIENAYGISVISENLIRIKAETTLEILIFEFGG